MSEKIKTDLRGKVNNIPHFKNEALLPLFEVISNSIDAIDTIKSINNGIITVTIIREDSLLPNYSGEIIGFEVQDNGIGFDTANFESFKTSDSTYKSYLGAKGNGRFNWLVAFDNVIVESTFQEDGKIFRREFNFNIKDIIKQTLFEEISLDESELRTTVKLVNFKKEYQKETSAYKKTSTIAQKILEHCLSYYIIGSAPKIVINDSLNEDFIDLSDLYTKLNPQITSELIKINDTEFTFNHIKLFTFHNKKYDIVLCAGNRAVKSLSIPITGLPSHFEDDGNRFIYFLYINSLYLDNTVNYMRQNFDIPQEKNTLNFDSNNISSKEIEETAICSAKDFLKEYIDIINKSKKLLIDNYVAKVDPTLRSIPKYAPNVYDEIGLNSSEADISKILNKHKCIVVGNLKTEISGILFKSPTNETDTDFIIKQCSDISAKVSEIQKDDLASYVIYRKLIIDLFIKKLSLTTNGVYEKEEVIHDLILKRYKSSDDLLYEDHNLWLLDENLTFHSFAKSEYRLKSNDRPDIFIYTESNDSHSCAHQISIIEIKRPQRNNYDSELLNQLNKYIRQIQSGTEKLQNGRILLVDDSTHYFCYLICDINDHIKKLMEDDGGFTIIKGSLGYFKYNKNLRAHFFVLAYDQLISDAIQRNKVFFTKLGLPNF
jgi:hypothetical protein